MSRFGEERPIPRDKRGGLTFDDCASYCITMKVATVRDVQHNLSEVLAWVAQGEEVQVIRRKRIVARLIPPEPQVATSPNFVERAQSIWGEHPKGMHLSEIVSESRGKR